MSEVASSSTKGSFPSSPRSSPANSPRRSSVSSSPRQIWEKAYKIQKHELPSFPAENENGFSPYLQKLNNIMEKNSTRHASFEVAARLAMLHFAEAKYSAAIKYFEIAMNGLVPLKAEVGWKLMFEKIGLYYATSLDNLGEFDKAEEIFNQLVESNANGEHIIEFAIFLQRRKKDMLRAQMFFERAIELFPRHASVCLKYASFMRHVRRDQSAAEIYYKRATDLDPNFAEALGNYASFLYGLRRNLQLVPSLYQRAVECDPFSTSNLCNYGLFLSEELGNYTSAEEIYLRALQINKTHSNTLYNYAVMLDTHLERKKEAEQLYRKAIVSAPGHAYALYNLAVLLEEEERKKGNVQNVLSEAEIAKAASNPVILEVRDLFARAAQADQKDADICADYGRFLLMRLGDVDNAEIHLHKALQLSPKNEVALFHMGSLLYKNKQDLLSAYSCLISLVNINGKHLPGRQQLARVLIDLQKQVVSPTAVLPDEFHQLRASMQPKDFLSLAIEHYEQCLRLASEPDRIILEFIRSVNKLCDIKTLARCIAFVDTVISGPSKYPDLNVLMDQIRSKLSIKKK